MVTPVISADDVVVGEKDGFAEFVVRLSAPSSTAVSVNFATSNGTAAYYGDFYYTSGSLTFAPLETVKTVRVPIGNDGNVESSESFFLNLSTPTNAILGTAGGCPEPC